jgi:hypothetical protein
MPAPSPGREIAALCLVGMAECGRVGVSDQFKYNVHPFFDYHQKSVMQDIVSNTLSKSENKCSVQT